MFLDHVRREGLLAVRSFFVDVTLNGDRLKCWDAATAQGSGTPGEILVADSSGLLVACGEQAGENIDAFFEWYFWNLFHFCIFYFR